ncbi:aldehyde dehydrogenase [Syntrophotalea acetylenivorans]|uniref:aldehyde dehydrogenase (NAD(+)) n=1 Tax=Syntrophotalea acetylenivorans TaxID=1842532 RepID=A0A1L3GLL4_9BACT|nr:aldehyde dehydrogenase family protein [Syntrophotalea acetylenivorans]APG26790.1 aldehyde dehydrogenase [Syntrophotalea acetylenivorans]
MIIRDKLYIDGQWVAAQGQEKHPVVNPATEEIIAMVPASGEQDVDDAVRAARAAFTEWGNTSVAQRAAWLKKLAEGLQARSEELAATITAELGMPLKFSQRIQSALPIANMEFYAGLSEDFAEERIGNSLVVREPVGVVACITPWNYPLHQIVAKVAPALLAGCTVVLKPSEETPLNAFLLAEVVAEAGLPAGVFNLISGSGKSAGESLAGHAGVDMISFTGSTRAGKRVSELAAATVKRVALELGGKSAALLLDDADLAAVIKATLNSCFINSGQTCNAMTRLIVPEDLYDQVTALAVAGAATFTVGDPAEGKAKLGPLVSARQQQRVREYIAKGVEEGAMLLCGGVELPCGLDKGFYVQPTIFGRVTPEMTIAREEIFGPVLSILCYRNEDEAVDMANDNDYGLAAAVWSGDDQKALTMARRLRAGQVEVNGGPYNLLAPFGGYKQSGNGRELGRYGLEEFLEVKSIQLPKSKD